MVKVSSRAPRVPRPRGEPLLRLGVDRRARSTAGASKSASGARARSSRWPRAAGPRRRGSGAGGPPDRTTPASASRSRSGVWPSAATATQISSPRRPGEGRASAAASRTPGTASSRSSTSRSETLFPATLATPSIRPRRTKPPSGRSSTRSATGNGRARPASSQGESTSSPPSAPADDGHPRIGDPGLVARAAPGDAAGLGGAVDLDDRPPVPIPERARSGGRERRAGRVHDRSGGARVGGGQRGEMGRHAHQHRGGVALRARRSPPRRAGRRCAP